MSSATSPVPGRTGTLEARQRAMIQRQAAVLQSVIDFQDQACLRSGLMAVADGLQQRFGCQRVCVGLWNGKMATVTVISQQASIDSSAAETRLLNAAMTEACQLDDLLHYNPTNARYDNATQFNNLASHSAELPTPAHRSLAAGRRSTLITTLPLCYQGKIEATLLLESAIGAPWGRGRLELLQLIADTLTPMIASRRAAERKLAVHLIDTVKQSSESLMAPKHLRVKLAVATTLVCLLALATIPVDQRVSAPAEIIPVELRTVSSPVDGYIQRIEVRAGDRVEPGQLLVSLDTRELTLQRNQSLDELARLRAELRVARATGDRKQTAMLNARYAQAQSQSELLEQRIERSAVKAPHAGQIVSTDLAQMAGAPVERGQRLLEIAPDTRYTINLMVDERDISLVSPGQRGELSLQANPRDRLVLEVDRIHPIALAEDGQNRFRVEASLKDAPPNLLPGQTGVGKVLTGQASTLHNLSRHFTHWLALQYWTWLG